MGFEEKNVIIKDHRTVCLRFALVYPSPYFTGMSNLAIRLIYELVNRRSDSLCERFFFTEYGDVPKSLESGMPLGAFDIIGFSVQHEMDYTRMLSMLSASSIPIRRYRRSHPIIIAGGPAVTSNPIPLEEFVDFFVIGEVESVLDRILEAAIEGESTGAIDTSSIPGLYSAGSSAQRIFVSDLGAAYHAVKQIHPVRGEGFSSSFLLEVNRGCSRGCRFCMECFVCGPRRERSLGVIKRILEEGIPQTGVNRITCISSAFFDHSDLHGILSYMRDRKLRFSLPSIRISDISQDLPTLLVAGGQRLLTLAPETPSERLRGIINKRFDEEQLSNILSAARQAGIHSLKLYFMIGIPGETESDLDQLAALLSKVTSSGFGPASIHLSVNPLVPKSNTPFQWAPMVTEQEYRSRLSKFRKICSNLGIRRVEFMDYRWGAIQAYLSTAGKNATDILASVVRDIEAGGRGDLGSWRRVLRRFGMDLKSVYVPKSVDENLPWESIKGATSKSILMHEFRRALRD